MERYFNINYEFDREAVHEQIARRLQEPGSDYICVADGVIMNTVNRKPDYEKVVNGGMFSICDSSYVPLYIQGIYGKRYRQYCGSEIFQDIIASRKYRMIFLGAQQVVLDGLRRELSKVNSDVEGMQFVELPFCSVEEFDYAGIAKMIEADGADIVWVALGAPKQEYFMARLKQKLGHGVMIAVGAAFKFFSDVDSKRAPKWMLRYHMEFIHRLMVEPRKQVRRCYYIIKTLPKLLKEEAARKRANARMKN
jgi:N-acetylglucosaminyldiphosphoundecaprenol N-acetyl-beta-D-mannosaminyltransferase